MTCKYEGCENLTSIEIPNSITSIGEIAFAYTGLVSVVIPSSVKYISSSTFYSCNKLESVVISNGVNIIGSMAFEGCKSLTSITIPSSVTVLCEQSFSRCNALIEIHCQNVTPPKFQMKYNILPFDDTTFNFATLFVPKNTINAYKNATVWKNSKISLKSNKNLRFVNFQ